MDDWKEFWKSLKDDLLEDEGEKDEGCVGPSVTFSPTANGTMMTVVDEHGTETKVEIPFDPPEPAVIDDDEASIVQDNCEARYDILPILSSGAWVSLYNATPDEMYEFLSNEHAIAPKHEYDVRRFYI